MSHLFVCFVSLVIQSGAMANFWPLHHLVYNQCMGENSSYVTCNLSYIQWCLMFFTCMTTLSINVWERIGEKHLAQLVGERACQPDIFTKYRLGCELSYGTCPIPLCAL